MVLRAADVEQPSTRNISRELGCDNHPVGKWRRRYHDLGFSGLQDAVRLGRPKIIAPPTRVQVIAVARALPQDQERPVTRWSLDAIATTLLETLGTDPISRSRIWRLLPDVALHPHKSEDWLQSHDEDFDAKAQTICQLYVGALESFAPGRLVLCCDEKSGRQVLDRKAPTQPARPGQRERREHEYLRRGTRVLINSLAVATGQSAWSLGATRKATDFVAHLKERIKTYLA
jgi:hypothetical protein